MKNILLSLLVIFLILGALGAAGFAGYRYGFSQGILTSTDGETQSITPRGFGFGLGPRRMPMHDFGFYRFDRDGFGMMQRGFGFGFFPPFSFLLRLLFWGLILWAVYMLFTRSGWRLTRTTQTPETQQKPTETEIRE
jgi:hypothetical protein